VHPAALDPGTEEDGLGRLGQPEVRVGDHQLHPAQATGFERAQKRGPERAILAVTHVHPKDFTVPIAAHPDRDNHGLRHHLVIDPSLAVGRVQKHIREARRGQAAAPERRDLVVELGADPGDFALGDPRRHPQRLDQVIDLAGRHAVQVGLHDHRE
jgi:hypothetical protein